MVGLDGESRWPGCWLSLGVIYVCIDSTDVLCARRSSIEPRPRLSRRTFASHGGALRRSTPNTSHANTRGAPLNLAPSTD